MENFRLSTFRTDESIMLCWNKLPEDILDKIPPYYFGNYYYITENNEIDSRTYVILVPVKKFRKRETVVEVSGINIGLDDGY